MLNLKPSCPILLDQAGHIVLYIATLIIIILSYPYQLSLICHKMEKLNHSPGATVVRPYIKSNNSRIQSSEKKAFHCDICKSGFAEKGNLSAHRKLHFEPVLRFKCDFCKKRFRWNKDRRKHQIIHDKNRKRNVNCGICNARFFDRWALAIHVMRVHDKGKNAKFQCVFCSRGFVSFSEFEIHVRSHINEKPYFCKLCEKSFTSSSSRNDHLKTHDPNSERPFQCEICSKTFHKRTILAQHSIGVHSTHREFQCQLCEKDYKFKVSLSRHHRKQHLKEKQERYKFKLCKNSYHSKTNLKAHVEQHLKSNPKQCPTCDKVYYNYFSYKSNIRIKHGELIPPNPAKFPCIFCKRSYPLKTSLMSHIRWHVEERPYFCKFCDADFNSPVTLRYHLGLHNPDRERKFKCEMCPSKFFIREQLRRHIQHVHTNELPYQCHICRKGFPNNQNRKRHIRTVHSDARPFPCSICGKGFKSEAEVKGHLTIHQPSRKLKCNLCNKILRSKPGFELHLRGHLGERPYKCNYCPKDFAYIKFRKRHEERWHIIK